MFTLQEYVFEVYSYKVGHRGSIFNRQDVEGK